MKRSAPNKKDIDGFASLNPSYMTAESLGLEDFLNKIADETVAQTEEEVLAYMQKVDHPALVLAPMF